LIKKVFVQQLACLHDLDYIPKPQDFYYFVDIAQKVVVLADKLAVFEYQEVLDFEASQQAGCIVVATIVVVEVFVESVADSKQHQLFVLLEYLFVVVELVVTYLETVLLFGKMDQP